MDSRKMRLFVDGDEVFSCTYVTDQPIRALYDNGAKIDFEGSGDVLVLRIESTSRSELQRLGEKLMDCAKLLGAPLRDADYKRPAHLRWDPRTWYEAVIADGTKVQNYLNHIQSEIFAFCEDFQYEIPKYNLKKLRLLFEEIPMRRHVVPMTESQFAEWIVCNTGTNTTGAEDASMIAEALQFEFAKEPCVVQP